MSVNHVGGNIQNAILLEEHEGAMNAKRVINIETLPTDTTKVNPSVTISNADSTVSYTKVIVKTINGVAYSKTLSYNVSDELLSMTAWTT